MTLEPAQQRLSGASILLQEKQPFFGTLLINARVSLCDAATAYTDGQQIFIGSGFSQQLSSQELLAVLAHEVLHIALCHVQRIQSRNRQVWNIACDVVVNSILTAAGFELPKDAILMPAFDGMDAETIYESLQSQTEQKTKAGIVPQSVSGLGIPSDDLNHDNPTLNPENNQQLRNNVIQQAANAVPPGTQPAWLTRLLRMATPKVDWRKLLSQYFTSSRDDYSGFDRRNLYRRYYLPQLASNTVKVALCIDTSGSIEGDILAGFLAEVQSLTHSTNADVTLYYADADISGPYPLKRRGIIPPPVGGGGTNFRPFFDAIKPGKFDVCVYLTDGCGTFPDQPPPMPCLWLVSQDGIKPAAFPFGRAIQL
jgi:predicted metal-dependent peptidase